MTVVIVQLLFGIVSGLLAHSKARNALGWFIAGCLIGPFALLVALLPMDVKEGVTRKCLACSETIPQEARICRYCHSEVEMDEAA